LTRPGARRTLPAFVFGERAMKTMRALPLALAALALSACTYTPPDCDAKDLIANATDVMNGSDSLKKVNVTVKEIRAMKEVSTDKDKNVRVCSGEVELSSGQILDLKITLDPKADDPSIFMPTVEWTPRE
jgi:hypothetical protein